MTNENYCMREDYNARTEYTHYSDFYRTDEWQLEVYLRALGLMKKYNLKNIIDVGCGSGYKLITYLGEYETVGIELAENIDYLNENYPNRNWEVSNFDSGEDFHTDLVICSDVIEHLLDPDELINFLKSISFEYLVISTPDRNMMYSDTNPFQVGPPTNDAHVREWNFEEFKEYIYQHFNIVEHETTNMEQSTQMIICTKKEGLETHLRLNEDRQYGK